MLTLFISLIIWNFVVRSVFPAAKMPFCCLSTFKKGTDGVAFYVEEFSVVFCDIGFTDDKDITVIVNGSLRDFLDLDWTQPTCIPLEIIHLPLFAFLS